MFSLKRFVSTKIHCTIKLDGTMEISWLCPWYHYIHKHIFGSNIWIKNFHYSRDYIITMIVVTKIECCFYIIQIFSVIVAMIARPDLSWYFLQMLWLMAASLLWFSLTRKNFYRDKKRKNKGIINIIYQTKRIFVNMLWCLLWM